MAIIPPVLLTISAIVVWVAEARAVRVKWTAVAIPLLVTWVATLVLSISLPSEVSLSAWRPLELFQSSLRLSLDIVSWRFIAMAVAVVLAFSIGTMTGERGAARNRQGAMLIYGSFAVMAMLAANLLTVVISWTVMDVLGFVVGARSRAAEGSLRQLVGRLAVESSGTILALVAVSASVSAGGGDEITARMASPVVGGLLASAVVLRVCLVPAAAGGGFALEPDSAVLGDTLRAGAAFAVLARAYGAGVPNRLATGLGVAGLILGVVGSLRWMLRGEPTSGRRDLMLGLTGVSMLSASLVPRDAGLPIMSGGLVLMIVVALLGLWQGKRPWQGIWPVLAGVMAAGLPWGASTWLNLGLISSLTAGEKVLLGVGGCLGLVFVAIGLARVAGPRVVASEGRAELPEVMRQAGKLLLVFTSVVIAQRIKGMEGLYDWVVFASVGTAAILGTLGFRRLPESVRGRLESIGAWVPGSALGERLRAVAERIVALARDVAGILEGEGGMLWVYVALLLVVIAISGGLM